jgi:hypothetical protein
MAHWIATSALVALACGALAAAPQAARAQDLLRPARRAIEQQEPDYWVGLSYGIINGVTLTDGATGNTWDFGYSPQLRATAEKRIQRGITAGVSASYSTAPLTYLSQGLSGGCISRCQAKADITQYLAFIRGGSGLGFHGTYMLEGGATSFSNFRDDATGATLAPTSASYDFTFGFGAGLGYGVSRTTDVYAAEQTDLVLHSQGSGTTSSAPRVYSLVAGARIGF